MTWRFLLLLLLLLMNELLKIGARFAWRFLPTHDCIVMEKKKKFLYNLNQRNSMGSSVIHRKYVIKCVEEDLLWNVSCIEYWRDDSGKNTIDFLFYCCIFFLYFLSYLVLYLVFVIIFFR